MGKFKDLTGLRFGRLTVIKRVENYVAPNRHQSAQWLCQCECGNTAFVTSNSLTHGRIKSCGCREGNYKQNGLYKQYPRLYSIWHHMKDRCYNNEFKSYNNYGGRGITVCDEWHDFKNFLEWALNNGYKDNLTIDRINVNGNYEPDNCRWIDRKAQNNNKRNNHLIIYKGETLTVKLMADKYDIPYQILLQRINRYGWTVEKAIETPIKKYKKKRLDK